MLSYYIQYYTVRLNKPFPSGNNSKSENNYYIPIGTTD